MFGNGFNPIGIHVLFMRTSPFRDISLPDHSFDSTETSFARGVTSLLQVLIKTILAYSDEDHVAPRRGWSAELSSNGELTPWGRRRYRRTLKLTISHDTQVLPSSSPGLWCVVRCTSTGT